MLDPIDHDTGTIAHSLLGPSSAVRRLQCPASYKAELTHLSLFGPEDSSYAREGTIAHKALELWVLSGEADCNAYLKENFGSLWEQHKYNLLPTVEWIDEWMSKGYALKIESRYDLTHLHPTCFGTADVTLIHAGRKHLIILDFKYGQGVGVDAEYGSFERVKEKSIVGVDANVQGVMYASGALKDMGLSDTDILDWTIDIAISQPRHGEEWLKSTTIGGFELVYAQDYIRDKFSTLMTDDNPAYRIGSHCQFCSARPTCPAQAKRVLDAFEGIAALTDTEKDMVENLDVPTEPSDEFDKTLGRLRALWDMKQECTRFFSQLDKFITECIQKGHNEKLGLELIPGRGRRAYPESIQTPEDLAEILSVMGVEIDVDAITKKELLPFTKVAQKLKKPERKILEDLLVQLPGSPKIAAMREGGDLLMDFGNVEILD
jgi:hypothetical protein